MQPDYEKLIDYLDKQLNQEETARVETILQEDIDFKKEFTYLRFAVDTIRLDVLNQKVASVRNAQKEQIEARPATSILRSMYPVSLRAAAVIVILLSVATVYKYSSVSNQSFYDKQFSGYELSNSRGEQSHEAETTAYQNSKWDEVISIYEAGSNHSNQQSFLAAMAEMQLHHFPNAITIFEHILNSKSGDTAYLEESEYYISFAYLMNHEGNKAIQMIEKIKENPNHTYYPMVSKFSPIDLKIIELKNK